MRRLEIDWLKTIAGALAAVVSAVLLSTLGAAGTLIGAALGSLVVTVSSAAFTQGLATSRQTLTKAQAGAVQKVGIAQAEVQRAGRVDDTRARESHLDHAEERLAEANRELDEATVAASATPTSTIGDRLSDLPWKRILLVSLGLFVAAVVAITAFELVAGRSVSSITGGSGDDEGTTIGDVRGGDGRDDQGDRGDRGDSPSEPATPTDGATPTGEPSPADETGDPPTDVPTESPTAPTETPTPADLSEQPDPSASP